MSKQALEAAVLRDQRYITPAWSSGCRRSEPVVAPVPRYERRRLRTGSPPTNHVLMLLCVACPPPAPSPHVVTHAPSRLHTQAQVHPH